MSCDGGARSRSDLELSAMRDGNRKDERELTHDRSLIRALGVWGLAAAIVNVTIGAGIFRLPAGVAGALGAAAPLAYLVCAVAMGLIVLCFAEAGSRVAMTGGPYAYIEVAFGPFVGFLGVEAALVPSGEMKNPARTVPRAVLLAIGVVALLYVSVQVVSQGILGAALVNAKTPVADAGGAALGSWGRTLILIGSTLSMFGYVSGMTLAVPRMLYAFARDGFLPRALASIHPRFHTPFLAIA